MQAYILLDRSGSMQSLWVEALSSVNAFAKELANKTDGPAVDSHVTLDCRCESYRRHGVAVRKLPRPMDPAMRPRPGSECQ